MRDQESRVGKSIRGLPFPQVTDAEQRAAILEVLSGLALSDHLGDVRDEEKTLWALLGVDDPKRGSDSPYRNFVRTCKAYGFPVEDEDDD
jgi:hypothetical protein